MYNSIDISCVLIAILTTESVPVGVYNYRIRLSQRGGM